MPYRNSLKGLAILMAAALAVVFAGSAAAQMPQQPWGQQQPSPLEREYMDIQKRLTQAQQQAFQNNPSLQEQMDEMEDLFTEKMRDAGYDPGALMETLLAAQGKLQEPGLSDAQRREVIQSREVVEAQRKWQEAQQAVSKDADVIAAQESFEENVMAAMRKEEPQTDSLIKRLEEIQRELQQRGMR